MTVGVEQSLTTTLSHTHYITCDENWPLLREAFDETIADVLELLRMSR